LSGFDELGAKRKEGRGVKFAQLVEKARKYSRVKTCFHWRWKERNFRESEGGRRVFTGLKKKRFAAYSPSLGRELVLGLNGRNRDNEKWGGSTDPICSFYSRNDWIGGN